VSASTPTYALPYPVGGDDVRDGDNTIKLLAERVETLLAARDATIAQLLALPGSRNVIRNGDCQIAQRGPGPFTTSGRYTIDGWYQFVSGGTMTANLRQLTLGTGARYGMESVVASQSAAGDFAGWTFVVEGVHRLAGQQATLSFEAFSGTGTPKVGVECVQYFGSGGAPSAIVYTPVAAITISTTKTRYFVTFTVPSLTGKTYGSSGTDSLQINIYLSSGTTNASHASSIGIQNATITLTDVQLEAGSLATPFDRLPQALQMVWNQRYFIRKLYSAANTAVASGTAWQNFDYYCALHYPTMRAAPTLTASAQTHFSAWGGGASGTSTAVAAAGTSADSLELHVNTAAGPTSGQGVWIRNGTAGAYLDLSSEL